MGELHGELMRKVEVVGLKSSTAIQAGYADVEYSGREGNVDAADSVSTITASSAHTVVDPGSGKRFQFFFFCR